MTAPSYFDWASRTVTRPDTDVVEFPDVLVTEEEATVDTMRRYLSAEERRAMELLP